MQRDQVDNENVTSPCTNHVKVGKGANGRPEEGSSVNSLHPRGIGEDQREDGNTFVIEGAGHGTGDVTCEIINSKGQVMGDA